MTVREIRKHVTYRNIRPGSMFNGKTKSRNTKRELCARLDPSHGIDFDAPVLSSLGNCLSTTTRELKKSSVYGRIPRGTPMTPGGPPKSKAKKNELCRYLVDRTSHERLIYDVVTGGVVRDGIFTQAIGIDRTTNHQIQLIYVHKRRAQNSEAFDLLMELPLDVACSGISGYAASTYRAQTGSDRDVWLLMVVDAPGEDQLCTVLASLQIEKYGATNHVELDAVCGTRHTDTVVRAMNLIRTQFDLVDVTGTQTVTTHCGRHTPLKLGSMLICIAIRWVLRDLVPSTPRIYLKSVPSAISRYGTNGFLPDGRKAHISRKDVQTFGANTFGPAATLDTMRHAQNDAVEKWARDPESSLVYMYMTNRRAHWVTKIRCNETLGLFATNIRFPNWVTTR